MDLHTLSERDLLTACLWAEARGEPRVGQQAVCNVITNRVHKHMGPTLHAVILKPAQFSWTNPTDPNYAQVLRAATTDPAGWRRAQELADAALDQTLPDLTLSADHYLNVELTRKLRGGTLPGWVEQGIRDKKVTVKIGRHTFFNLLG